MAKDAMTDVRWVPIKSIHPSSGNPRNNAKAIEPVSKSLKHFGWQQPIVVRRDMEIVAGHTRYQAALSLDMDRVPIKVFEGTDDEARAYQIADNKAASYSDWDPELLASFVATMDERTRELSLLQEREIAQLRKDYPEPFGEGPPDQEDPGAQQIEGKARTVLGDMWLLGDHRILCGDSTNPADMDRLCGGEKAHLLATDPPYLVDYDGGNHPSAHNRRSTGTPKKKAGTKSDHGNKEWTDYIDPTDTFEFVSSVFKNALGHCVERVPVYQWHAFSRQAEIERAWRAVGLLLHQQVIWMKSRRVLTRSHMLWAHEPCFYGWPEGKQPQRGRKPSNKATTVWEIGQKGEYDGIHPTQKPLDIFRWPIQWHTKKGELCLEPFSGSGSQLIAAEQLQRRCYAMELSPPFVDAAVMRWQKMTGRPAIHSETGTAFDDHKPGAKRAAPAKRRAKA